MSTAVLGIFLASILVNTCYLLILSYGIKTYKSNIVTQQEVKDDKVSIIVCVREITKRIDVLISHLAHQTYSGKIEVIIVSQNQSDRLDHLAIKEDIDLSLLYNPYPYPSKKTSLLQGLKNASSEMILLTDDDCKPENHWVEAMINQSKEGAITLGYSPMENTTGLINLWSRFETALTGLQYLGLASLGKPYMGVGRSIAFKKSTIEHLTLDHLHPTLPGGDDDFLVQWVNKATLCLSEQAGVLTESKTTLSDYIKQKTRHYSAATLYPKWTNITLSIFSMTQVTLILSGLILLLLGVWQPWLWLVVALRYILLIPSLLSIFTLYKSRKMILLLPIFDIILAVHYMLFATTYLMPKPKTW